MREYASQLNEFFSLLGQDEETNGVEMVSKFWYGLNQGIQQQLWLECLNPECSSYKQVLHTAKTIEMSQGVIKKFGSQYGNSDKEPDSSKWRKGKQGDRSHRQNGHTEKGHRDQGRSSHQHHSPSRQKMNSTPGFNSNDYRRNNRNSDLNQRRPDRRKPVHRLNLSKEEMERLHTENRCFGCKEVGHSYRQCPKRHQIASSSNGKPPGMRSINQMEISAIHEVEELWALAEMTECSNIIELGMLGFDIDPTEESTTSDRMSEQSYETCLDHFPSDSEPPPFIAPSEDHDSMPELIPVDDETIRYDSDDKE